MIQIYEGYDKFHSYIAENYFKSSFEKFNK